MRIGWLMVLFGTQLCGVQVAATENPYRTFEETILRQVRGIEERLGCRVGFDLRDRDYALRVRHREHERFHAASTMKVPVMIEVFRQAEAGRYSLQDELLVDPNCPSFLEATTFVCDAGPYLASRLHERVAIRVLVQQMITASDNLATNLLIQHCGYRQINSTMRSLGARSGYVLRGVQDIPAFEAGLSNRMTAHDLNSLLEAIENGEAASASGCAEMREILLGQTANQMIPRDLPETVRVAHKTGEITGNRHDTAIVYASFGTWFLTVLLDDLQDPAAGKDAIAKLSRTVYDARQALQLWLPELKRSFRVEFTPARVHLTKEYARQHYSRYYEARYGTTEMPGLEIEPRVLVVHYTAGDTLEGAFRTFAPETLGGRPYLNQAGALNVGVQFVVDRDGTIYQIMPDNAFARHCIGLNHCAIGFENIGRGDISEAALRGEEDEGPGLTMSQLRANEKLIRYLRYKYPEIRVLIGHSEYRDLEHPQHPGTAFFQENDPEYRTVKSDPGPRFMSALRERLADLLQPGTNGQVFRDAQQ